jgi:hypothetical protein
MNKRSQIFIVMLSFFISSNGQEIKNMQNLFLETEYFFLNGDYSDALPSYLQLYEQMPENANLAYRIGACYLNIHGQKNLSIDYLETASKNMSAKHKEGTISHISAPYDALYDLANAYLINYKFDLAKEAFTRYSETLLPDDRENRAFLKHLIGVCDNAKELIASPISYTEENMGEIFNDDKPNYNPVISSDGKSFAFMVSLKFYDAIMHSRLINGKWSSPLNISPELQIDGKVFISCLSADGKTLFLSKNDNFNSDIYYSTFNGTSWAPAIKVGKNVNTKYWESHAFLSDDGNQLIFSSDRPGGFGGLDLYISRKIKGEWGPAVNMGPEINTPFNEDRAFLINNGKTLFFSSQGHFSMGGYDIFRSDLQSNNLWNKPQNLGYPLNSPDDNFFFMPTGTGKTGYYSLVRESGSGKEDIYRITMK